MPSPQTEPAALPPATSRPRRVRVALLGLGTVGGATRQLLAEQRDHIRHATGCEVDVVAAMVRDPARRMADGGDDGIAYVSDIDGVLAAQPDVACEALGGLEPARTAVRTLLERGVPVVTANKQLVARHGSELMAAAERAGTQMRLEASVGGAMPIVRMLRESLAAARVERLAGILNGTTNYVLSAMDAGGRGYAEALARAQELGYAEPDPTDDIDGADAAAKIAILAGIAFQTTVEVERVACRTIRTVDADDIATVRALDFVVKPIARATRLLGAAGGVERVALDVGPALVPRTHPLANVHGATNAVLVAGDPFGQLVVQGAGAGGPETASALAGDLVGVIGSSPGFLTRDPHVRHLEVAADTERCERHYVRLRVADRAGELARVAGALAQRGVSVERVLQQRGSGGRATLVLVTHPAPAGALAQALADEDPSDAITMPVLDDAATVDDA